MFVRIACLMITLFGCDFINPVVYAASTRVEPFIGAIQESWESFPNFRSTLDTLGHKTFLTGSIPIFNGLATISHPKMGIYEPDIANYNRLSSGRAQTTQGQKGVGLDVAGPQILPEYIQPASITFATPLTSFGGYWAAGTDYLFDPEVIEFKFFDPAGNLVGADAFPYSRSFLINEEQMIFWGDGELQWMGWQFFIPVQRIDFGGGAVVADFLQANPVPEPASVILLWVGTLVAFLLRHNRRSTNANL